MIGACKLTVGRCRRLRDTCRERVAAKRTILGDALANEPVTARLKARGRCRGKRSVANGMVHRGFSTRKYERQPKGSARPSTAMQRPRSNQTTTPASSVGPRPAGLPLAEAAHPGDGRQSTHRVAPPLGLRRTSEILNQYHGHEDPCRRSVGPTKHLHDPASTQSSPRTPASALTFHWRGDGGRCAVQKPECEPERSNQQPWLELICSRAPEE